MKTHKRKIIFYETSGGERPVELWLNKIKDLKNRSRVLKRITQAGEGNWGDYKAVEKSLIELRMFFKSSPGFRVYVGIDGSTILVLLFGGDKSSQQKDLEKAKSYWIDYLENK